MDIVGIPKLARKGNSILHRDAQRKAVTERHRAGRIFQSLVVKHFLLVFQFSASEYAKSVAVKTKKRSVLGLMPDLNEHSVSLCGPP